MKSLIYAILLPVFISCAGDTGNSQPGQAGDTVIPGLVNSLHDTAIYRKKEAVPLLHTGTTPDELVAFAKTLIGVPYLYASTDPEKGFDCSGFITYVFNHFNIKVPRSSVDFTNYGKEMTPEAARPGDLILFTGTDSTLRIVGHMGIIVSNEQGKILFIHSSSGKANGVVITPLERYYLGRFVKVVRVFPDSLFVHSA